MASPAAALDRRIAEAVRLFEAGQIDKAERLCGQIQRKEPRNPVVLALMGASHCDRGRHAHGIRLLGDSLAIRDNPSVRTMLGNLLLRLGRPAEAVPHFAAAHEAAPADPAIRFGLAAARCNLGAFLLEQNWLPEARAELEAALTLQPNLPQAWANLGTALLESGEGAASLDAFRKALALQPDDPSLLCNLANGLYRENRLAEALHAYDASLARAPDFAEAHFGRAVTWLALGAYDEGWAEYEWRFRVPRLAQRGFAEPQWDGERLDGRTILLHAEGGDGDSLQFLRYVPEVAASGGRVVLEVPARLARLCAPLAGVAELRSFGEALPGFAVQCSLQSLPRAFRTRLDTIPAAPYLAAPADLAAEWARRLGPASGLRVGLVWAGGTRPGAVDARVDARRSMRLADLRPLAASRGVQFFSLQLGPPAAQLADADWVVENVMTEIGDFADTAAIIANLDLVISVDTAVAHLAAAMGRPVWLLSRFDACWRWLRGRRDSPWYPTLRLYTQPEPGNWHPVIAQIVEDLAAFARP